MMDTKDRLARLLDPSNRMVNGIDFVEIASKDQTILRVHFLNKILVANTISAVSITGGETIPEVPVKPINDATDWTTDSEERPLLTLFAEYPGDFSFYTLTLNSSSLDPFYNQVTFSFKARCPSDLDCAALTLTCPPIEDEMPPIDYLAKDFMSFRQALSDFSAQRYPEWQERSEADFGMMFMEALCSLADNLSYLQDRVAAEAMLDTATQRRSLVRLARLADYDPSPAIAASVWLQVDVPDTVPSLGSDSGLKVSARGPDGLPISFEIGTGLIDKQTGQRNQTSYPVNSAWNRCKIKPYWLDDSQICLKAGTTSMWVTGLTGITIDKAQSWSLLLDTAGPTSADPPIREMVQLTDAIDKTDYLFGDKPITQIFWRPEDALQHDHDLTRTVLAGNLVPATQGDSYSEQFAIDTAPASNPQMPLAIVRTGPNNTPDIPSVQYLWTLQNAPLAWLAQDTPGQPPLPEIILKQLPASFWRWRRSLLDADQFESAFTVDPMRYIPVARNSDQTVSYEYDGDAGDTIRFGDGVFGEIPASGAVFQAMYRVGGGAKGNVAADAITNIDPAIKSITAVTNPFPATGGADEETDQSVQRLAPQAFRAQQFRAVRPEDYEAAAEQLSWVLQAGTTFRWTGSWLTVFTTADPRGTETITLQQQTDLINLLNRYRLAGYESYAPAPFYISLDLLITVCAQPTAFRGDVEAAILSALSTQKFPNGTTGFFYYDNFTFGQPLVRSTLAAAIQNAQGVAGVLSICYRQRGVIADYISLPATIFVPPHALLRVDNDPSRPERGSIKVIVEGGK